MNENFVMKSARGRRFTACEKCVNSATGIGSAADYGLNPLFKRRPVPGSGTTNWFMRMMMMALTDSGLA